MNPFRISREDGFSILEVVFAVTILAIGIMGYTILKTSSRHSRVYSKSLSQAIQLTTTQLDGLLVRGFHDPLLLDPAEANGVSTHLYSTEVATATDNWGDNTTLLSGDFQAEDASWTVYPNCPSELTKMIDFSTIWNGGGKSMEITQVQVRP